MRVGRGRGIIETSPCTGIKPPSKETRRDRLLRDDELVRIWRGADQLGWPFGPLVQLLATTAARRNEVADMCWSEIDFDTKLWSIPAEKMKGGKRHVVPLSPLALEILTALPRFG